MKKIDDSRHLRINRCYSNMSKRQIHIREQINFKDNPNIYKKDEILKKPGLVLHIDGDNHLSNLKKLSNNNTFKQVTFNRI